jgi:hypothetical protein
MTQDEIKNLIEKYTNQLTISNNQINPLSNVKKLLIKTIQTSNNCIKNYYTNINLIKFNVIFVTNI